MKKKFEFLKNDYFVTIVLTLYLLFISSYGGNGIFGPTSKYIDIKAIAVFTILFLIMCVYRYGVKFLFTKENIIGISAFILLYIPVIFFSKSSNTVGVSFYVIIALCIYNVFRYLKYQDNRELAYTVAFTLFIELLLVMLVSDYYILFCDRAILYLRIAYGDYIKNYFGLKSLYLVGNFGTVHVAPVVIIMSFYGLLKKNRIFVVSLILSLIMIVFGNNFIPILGFVFSIFIYLFVKVGEKFGYLKTGAILILIAVLGLMGIIMLYETGVDFPFRARFDMIFRYFKYGEMFPRLLVYMKPINGIIKNKFLFVPDRMDAFGHSTILDTMANIGFLSIPFFVFHYLTFKEVADYANVKILNMIIIGYYIFVNLLNPSATKESLIFIYIIYPQVIRYLNDKFEIA